MGDWCRVMSEYIKSYEDLRIWQDAMHLAEIVYDLCSLMPKEEIYGLTSQMKRAAISVPSNIAEGSERNNTKELIQFLYIARGSLAELRTQLVFAQRMKYLTDSKDFEITYQRLSKGISSLIKTLQKPSPVTRHPSRVTLTE